MDVSEMCQECGGIKGSPDDVSLTLHCDCPAFPSSDDVLEYQEYEESEGQD